MRWSTVGSCARPPPTCVFVHGILGSRRNVLSFAQRLARVHRASHISVTFVVKHMLHRAMMGCTGDTGCLLIGVVQVLILTSCCHTQEFSSWQILLVDLRCHGESARHGMASHRPNGVESAAADVLDLLRHLKLFPEVLIGHSFGGKVVMSMADQFGRIGPRLPRAVQVCCFPCPFQQGTCAGVVEINPDQSLSSPCMRCTSGTMSFLHRCGF